MVEIVKLQTEAQFDWGEYGQLVTITVPEAELEYVEPLELREPEPMARAA